LIERCEYLHALLISTPDTVGQLQVLEAVMAEEYYRFPSNGKLSGLSACLDDVDNSLPYAKPLEVVPVVSLDVVKSAKLSVSAINRTPTPDV
jgi:hypothetical protein